MALASRLFQGDRALEACLVQDSAHLIEGTRGPHVGKVQQALVIIDGALISQAETAAQTYGRSTANAVLAYKRRRNIINRAYQTAPDNIVGKMTIAALDRDMVAHEVTVPLRGCRSEIGPGGRGRGLELAVGDSPVRFTPAHLNVEIQDALLSKEVISTNSLRNVLLTSRADQLLRPFGMSVSARFLPSFPYDRLVGERVQSDVLSIRKASENASAKSGRALRVIFCHLERTSSTAVSHGPTTGVDGFGNFVLINKDRQHPDNGTLLHEMIHCADNSLMDDWAHKGGPDNIFDRGSNRTVLSQVHADFLFKATFRS